MRTFIAIALPEQIKDTLAALEQELKKTNADVKWVTPENIHLTLKFLGEIDEKKLEKIKLILDETAKDRPGFLLGLSGVGAFPKINSPRVIWAGVSKGEAEVRQIAGELEEKIASVGIAKEKRPFSGHITIGRTRSSLNQEKLVKGLENLAGFLNQEFPVNKITLFKSTLTPLGPNYEILKETALKTA